MSKFNSKSVGTKTVNDAGGVAYSKSNKLELATLVLTSFVSDKAYESEAQTTKRLVKLFNSLNSEDKQFFAKASIYARDKFRLRSISHLCSAILAEAIVQDTYTEEDKKWLEGYFNKVVLRADDITEIISAYSARPNCYKNKKGVVQLPNVVKRGFSKAMGNFDSYVMAKYKQSNSEISLLDAARMCHAKKTSKNEEGLQALFDGTLKNTETWEAKQSKAGQDKTNKAEAKKKSWAEFLAKGDRIEYFALLRNLRNIVETKDNELIEQAATLLVNPKLIEKSRVLPFRFLTAYYAVKYSSNRSIVKALNKAMELSLSNVPELPGKTAILVDISGSMSSSYGGEHEPIKLASIFASVLFKTNDADVVAFGTNARMYDLNPDDTIFTLADKFRANGGGTNMSAGFEKLTKKYDRVIILSDMQTWEETMYYGSSAKVAFHNYKRRHNPNCKLYSMDLTGHSKAAFPEDSVFCLAGLSEHIFDIMKTSETDKNALIHEIDAVELI